MRGTNYTHQKKEAAQSQPPWIAIEFATKSNTRATIADAHFVVIPVVNLLFWQIRAFQCWLDTKASLFEAFSLSTLSIGEGLLNYKLFWWGAGVNV